MKKLIASLIIGTVAALIVFYFNFIDIDSVSVTLKILRVATAFILPSGISYYVFWAIEDDNKLVSEKNNVYNESERI